jgi:hypothetical protein
VRQLRLFSVSVGISPFSKWPPELLLLDTETPSSSAQKSIKHIISKLGTCSCGERDCDQCSKCTYVLHGETRYILVLFPMAYTDIALQKQTSQSENYVSHVVPTEFRRYVPIP